jgi:hypothetical protein
MSASQPQGHRTGEGTAGLWNHIREDDRRKEREPDGGTTEDARQQHGDGQEQQQPQRCDRY